MKVNFIILAFLVQSISSFAQKYDAKLIKQKTNIEIRNNKLTKAIYYEYKIYNRSGEKYTKIAIPYSSLNKVSKITAYVKDSNGRIVKKLKKSDIIDRSSISDFSLYVDDFVKEFTLKHNSYPYTIVYSYQAQQNEFYSIDYWTPIIGMHIPTLSAQLTVSIPSNYKISFKTRFVDEPIIDTLENTIKYQWDAKYTDTIRPEYLSPSTSNLLPSVAIVPVEFHYDKKGSYKNWISFGKWQYDLLQGLNVLPDTEKVKIQALIKNIDNDKERIRVLYHFLQNETRYINVTIETGGYKPYPASYVAKNKYGDCKALTNYFKSVLDYVNIPSYYTIIYAGSPINKIHKTFPSPQFNHAILYIPLPDEDIWLDCTSDGAFNSLGTFTQNRNAFVVFKDSSKFIKTPSLEPKDVLETRKIQIKYNPKDATAIFTNRCRGKSYEDFLQLERNYNESDKSIIIRNYFMPDGFQLIDYQITNPNRDSVEIELSYSATTQSIYKHYGKDILINTIKFSLPSFEKPHERKRPIQIDYPIYKIDTLIYEIPRGYKPNKSPDSYAILNKYGAYNFNIYTDSSNITIIKSLLIKAGNYPYAEYGAFYNFYTQILEIDTKTHLSLYK